MEAVLVAMSCFSLLCEEAEIRCGSDEVAVTCLLPNYHLYVELAQASTVLTTGELRLRVKSFFFLIPYLTSSKRDASLKILFYNSQRRE